LCPHIHQIVPAFEAEIIWLTVERLADNDMIEHVDLQYPGPTPDKKNKIK